MSRDYVHVSQLSVCFSRIMQALLYCSMAFIGKNTKESVKDRAIASEYEYGIVIMLL